MVDIKINSETINVPIHGRISLGEGSAHRKTSTIIRQHRITWTNIEAQVWKLNRAGWTEGEIFACAAEPL
jgi:hypothetical protein